MQWSLTQHATQQMHARRFLREQLDELLARPQHTQPDPKRQEGVRLYVGHGITASVAEGTNTVLTVGIQGASKEDWHEFPAPAARVLAARGGRASASTTRTRRKREPARPVASRNVLDEVHPGIAETVRRELRRRGLDFRAIRVDSPTVVSVVVT
jgi:hypothetical protein